DIGCLVFGLEGNTTVAAIYFAGRRRRTDRVYHGRGHDHGVLPKDVREGQSVEGFVCAVGMGAAAGGGGFSSAAVERHIETGGLAVVDTDLYGDQRCLCGRAGLYRRSSRQTGLVPADPAGRNDHADVLPAA